MNWKPRKGVFDLILIPISTLLGSAREGSASVKERITLASPISRTDPSLSVSALFSGSVTCEKQFPKKTNAHKVGITHATETRAEEKKTSQRVGVLPLATKKRCLCVCISGSISTFPIPVF